MGAEVPFDEAMNGPRKGRAAAGSSESFLTLADAVYHRLRKDLLSGRLAPGSRLKLDSLRAAYDVGMSPLREALFRLEPEGLVIGEGQRGFKVAPVSVEDLWDVTRLRVELESTAIRESIAKGGDEWEVGIVAAGHRLLKLRRNAAVDYEEVSAAHRQFHHSLVAACGSPWKLHFISIIYDHSERYRRLSVQNSLTPRKLEAEHQAIADACLDRDADRACALHEEHLVQTARIVMTLPPFDVSEAEQGEGAVFARGRRCKASPTKNRSVRPARKLA